MIPIFDKFVGGKNIKEAIDKSRKLKESGFLPIFDYIKEGNCTTKKETMKELRNLSLQVPKNSSIAVKLSSIGYGDDTLDFLEKMSINSSTRIMIDAEQVSIQENINNITNTIINRKNLNHPIFFKTYQMYRKDSLNNLKNDINFFNKSNCLLGVKLVRGAYHQEDRKTGLLFNKKEDTDKSYREACELLFDTFKNTNNMAVFATHNDNDIENIKHNVSPQEKQFAFAHLLGMSDKKGKELINRGYTVYKYLPYGKVRDSFPYLFRRLLENSKMVKYLFY